jgi:uncharacterized membrane protein YdjX (TVP38/TMEM64 family)
LEEGRSYGINKRILIIYRRGVEMSTKKTKDGMGKIIGLVALIIVVFILANQFNLVDKLKDIKGLQSWFQGLGVIGYIAYILIYILVAVFMFPASAITIAAGITFGSMLGGTLALIGSTIGACVAFIIAKYVARNVIVSRFSENIIFKKIEKGVAENGTSFLILTRLVPVFPYNIQNYAYGVTSIKLGTFGLVSLVTMAPGAFIYAFMAGEIAANGFSLKLLIQFAVAGLFLFMVSLIPKYIAKKKGISINK